MTAEKTIPLDGVKAKEAERCFKSGCNCCQAVVMAFAPELGLPEETLLRLSSSFGGGVGRMREICGAVSGMAIVLGLLRGYSRPFAVRFSFLLSLPAVLGANILSLVDVIQEGGVVVSEIPMYLAGMLVAMASGYFAIRLVKLLSDKGKFGKFAYYCWAVGAIALVASFVVK